MNFSQEQEPQTPNYIRYCCNFSISHLLMQFVVSIPVFLDLLVKYLFLNYQWYILKQIWIFLTPMFPSLTCIWFFPFLQWFFSFYSNHQLVFLIFFREILIFLPKVQEPSTFHDEFLVVFRFDFWNFLFFF